MNDAAPTLAEDVERIQNHQPEEKPASEVKIDSDIPVPEGEENGN